MTPRPMELCATWAFTHIHLPQGVAHATLLVHGISDGLTFILYSIRTNSQALTVYPQVKTLENEASIKEVL